MQGKIVKGIAGFYYVYVVGSGIYECKAKGIFRKEGTKPLVGDDVEIEVLDEEEKKGNLEKVYPRRNEMQRPAAANVDQALILFAVKTPAPNYLLLDRFLISAEMRGIPCIIGLNKCDTAESPELLELQEAYEACGHRIFPMSVRENRGLEEIREYLKGKTTVLAGPSGVGKSSLTNAILGSDAMETGEISKKLARGKNTTRHCELLYAGEDTWLCDTPGFSAFDTIGIEKEDLKVYYDEFAMIPGKCRFDGCVHVSEPDCVIKDAVKAGRISSVRYENYRYLFEELKEAERRRY